MGGRQIAGFEPMGVEVRPGGHPPLFPLPIPLNHRPLPRTVTFEFSTLVTYIGGIRRAPRDNGGGWLGVGALGQLLGRGVVLLPSQPWLCNKAGVAVGSVGSPRVLPRSATGAGAVLLC